MNFLHSVLTQHEKSLYISFKFSFGILFLKKILLWYMRELSTQKIIAQYFG